MKNRLLILGASVFQVPFIEEAIRLGCYVGIVDINKDAPGVSLANKYFRCSLQDKEAVLKIAKRFDANGITVGTCEIGVLTAAYIAEKMGLPFYSQDVAVRTTNKISMIQAFKTMGVACPEYEIVRPGDKIETNIPYPVITKPADKSASRGIYYVKNQSELEYAVNFSMKASDSKEVLIQEYMDGPEISVELGIEGDKPVALQVTEKITNGPPHYIEIGQIQPAKLSKEIIDNVKKLACDAAKSIGLQNCAGHAEIKLTANGPKMVEIGGRMGGHFIDSYLLENSTGYKLQETVIRYALGERFILRRKTSIGEAGMMCILSQEGKIISVTGVDEAKSIPGVIKVVINCQVGHCYHSGISNNDLIGYVIALGDNRNNSMAICEEALSKIKIKYI